MFGIIGIEYVLQNPQQMLSGIFLIIPVGTIFVTLNSYLLAKVNKMLIEEIVEKLQGKEEYKFVIDNLVNSIIIV